MNFDFELQKMSTILVIRNFSKIIQNKKLLNDFETAQYSIKWI
jgi:hypothetical protein